MLTHLLLLLLPPLLLLLLLQLPLVVTCTICSVHAHVPPAICQSPLLLLPVLLLLLLLLVVTCIHLWCLGSPPTRHSMSVIHHLSLFVVRVRLPALILMLHPYSPAPGLYLYLISDKLSVYI
jgi:hypothetical protein